MAQVLRAFGNVLDPYQVPTGLLTVDQNHPLANGLVGCWVPGVMGGINIVFPSELAVVVNRTLQIASEGPGIVSEYENKGGTAQTFPKPMQTTNGGYSVYFRGYNTTAGSIGSFHDLLSLYYNDGSGGIVANPPEYCLGVQDDGSGTSKLRAVWNVNTNGATGTSVAYPTQPGIWSVTAVLTQAVNVALYYGATSQTTTALGAGTMNFATGNLIALNGANNMVMTIGCFWNRPLSASEVAWMDREPYGFLLPVEPEMTILKAIASTIVFRKTLSQIGGRIGTRQASMGWFN